MNRMKRGFRRRSYRLSANLVALAVVAAACGGSGAEEPAAPATTAAPAASVAEPTPPIESELQLTLRSLAELVQWGRRQSRGRLYGA